MTLFFGSNEFAATALVARDKPGLFTSTLVLMMVLNVGLNMALIAPVGVTGAALAALVSGSNSRASAKLS